uniref:Uncharacterized protein n=1 Tax=Amphimedon queenslandica TaxID=400682 RepID=A0A1X7TJN9_AMPQE
MVSAVLSRPYDSPLTKFVFAAAVLKLLLICGLDSLPTLGKFLIWGGYYSCSGWCGRLYHLVTRSVVEQCISDLSQNPEIRAGSFFASQTRLDWVVCGQRHG